MTRALCRIDGCAKPAIALRCCDAHYRRLKAHGDPFGGRTPRGTLQREIEMALVGAQPDKCWFWPYSRFTTGYAQIRIGGRGYSVHRIVCFRAHGAPESDELEVAHSCGMGHLACINPHHLRWDTRAGNHADKIVHGTDNRGNRNHQAKLTAQQVREIRVLSATGSETASATAARLGISRTTISEIRAGRNWGWLE